MPRRKLFLSEGKMMWGKNRKGEGRWREKSTFNIMCQWKKQTREITRDYQLCLPLSFTQPQGFICNFSELWEHISHLPVGYLSCLYLSFYSNPSSYSFLPFVKPDGMAVCSRSLLICRHFSFWCFPPHPATFIPISPPLWWHSTIVPVESCNIQGCHMMWKWKVSLGWCQKHLVPGAVFCITEAACRCCRMHF